MHIYTIQVAFGMDINSLHDDQSPFPKAIATVLKAFMEMIRSPFRVSVRFYYNVPVYSMLSYKVPIQTVIIMIFVPNNSNS